MSIPLTGYWFKQLCAYGQNCNQIDDEVHAADFVHTDLCGFALTGTCRYSECHNGIHLTDDDANPLICRDEWTKAFVYGDHIIVLRKATGYPVVLIGEAEAAQRKILRKAGEIKVAKKKPVKSTAVSLPRAVPAAVGMPKSMASVVAAAFKAEQYTPQQTTVAQQAEPKPDRLARLINGEGAAVAAELAEEKRKLDDRKAELLKELQGVDAQLAELNKTIGVCDTLMRFSSSATTEEEPAAKPGFKPLKPRAKPQSWADMDEQETA